MTLHKQFLQLSFTLKTNTIWLKERKAGLHPSRQTHTSTIEENLLYFLDFLLIVYFFFSKEKELKLNESVGRWLLLEHKDLSQAKPPKRTKPQAEAQSLQS